MINLVKEVAQTQVSSQSAAATHTPTRSKPHATPMDIIRISAAAKAALHEATEPPVETTEEAQSGQVHAQRLMEKQAASKELLGLE
jgi:hypothetical protein